MRLSLSIVSHGQGELVEKLLGDISSLGLVDFEILLTINVNERLDFLSSFSSLPIRIIRNSQPLGFGNNHNNAASIGKGTYFVIVNPDIRLPIEFDIESLLVEMEKEPNSDSVAVAASGPMVCNPNGAVEQNARPFPTFIGQIVSFFSPPRAGETQSLMPPHAQTVDWLAGMFVVFDAKLFAEVGGFDEKYYMYMEDVDICRRLKAHGKAVLYVPKVRVIHDARRASHSNMRHLSWHIRSTLRYFLF